MDENLQKLKALYLSAHAINLLKLTGQIHHQLLPISCNMKLILSEIQKYANSESLQSKMNNCGLCIYFENYTFILKSNAMYEIYFTKNIHELESNFIEKIKNHAISYC